MKPVSTGKLMAINLHFGTLVTENPYSDTLYINSDTAHGLEGKLPEKDICIAESPLNIALYKDALSLDSIFEFRIHKEFLTNHGSSNFGKDEEFVLNIMQEQGIISKSARHGNDALQEADIVDEADGQQYEILYEFKNSLLDDKTGKAIKDPRMAIVQHVDNQLIHPSEALLKNFLRKVILLSTFPILLY